MTRRAALAVAVREPDLVEMPSPYDDFTERAHPGYAGGTLERRARRDLLRAAMEKEGFTVAPNEWWHFNYEDRTQYPILDVPFADIGEAPPASPHPPR